MKFESPHCYSIFYCFSYVFLGSLGLSTGLLIPIKAKQIGIPQTDFASVFIVGGFGGLFASYTCNKLEKCLTWHQISAVCYLVLSLCGVALVPVKSLLLFALIQFILIYSLTILGIITQVALLQIQKQNSEIWLKLLHMSFSVAAFITPIILSIFMMKALYYYFIYGIILTGLYFYIQFPDTQAEINDKLIIKQQVSLKNKQQNNIQVIPHSLHFLLFIFFFSYSTVQNGYSGWITTYGSMSKNITINQALYAPGIFWFFITIGRFLSIFMTLIWNIEQQITVLTTGLLVSAILAVIFTLNGLDRLILYLISCGFGFFMSSMYPLMMSIPRYFGYSLKTQHTSKYGLAVCLAILIMNYITGLGMSYFGKYYFIFNELLFCIGLYALVKLILNLGRQLKVIPSSQTQMTKV